MSCRILTPLLAASACVLATAPVGTTATDAVGFSYAGIHCFSDTATGVIDCEKTDRVGYVVGISLDAVGVERIRPKRVVFVKRNSGEGQQVGLVPHPLFTFNRVHCGARPVGTVFCARTDNTGFALSISRSRVAVIRLSDMKLVFTRRNVNGSTFS